MSTKVVTAKTPSRLIVPDMYEGNKDPNYQRMAAGGILFQIHKVSEGTGHVDSKYEVRRKSAADYGIGTVGYHYGHPANDPDKDASHFASLVHPEDFPYILDLEIAEGHPPVHLQQWKAAYFAELRTKLPKHDLVLYSYLNFLIVEMGNPNYNDGEYLWLADYTPDGPVDRPVLPRAYRNYWAWQYTSSGGYPGSGQRGDVSVTAGGVDAFKYPGGKPTVKNPTPKPTLSHAQQWAVEHWIRYSFLPKHYKVGSPEWAKAWKELSGNGNPEAYALYERYVLLNKKAVK